MHLETDRKLIYTMSFIENNKPKGNHLLNSLKTIAGEIKKRRKNINLNLNKSQEKLINTFQNNCLTSREQQISKDKKELSHEALLRKDLIAFRTEIEEKFKKSEVNKAYKFPRKGFFELNSIEKDFYNTIDFVNSKSIQEPKINRIFDF